MPGDPHEKSIFFLKHLMNQNYFTKNMIIYERCGWSSDEHFSSKYFTKFTFVHETSSKWLGGFGHYRHESVKSETLYKSYS